MKGRRCCFAAAMMMAGSLCLCACGRTEDSEAGGKADSPGRQESMESENKEAENKETENKEPENGESRSGSEEGADSGAEGLLGESEESILSGEGILSGRKQYHLESFGENVWFFAPQDDPEAVQQELDALWGRQETNQFGDARYAVYFLPGEYDDSIRPKVGFYTQLAGLGAMPDEVSLYTVGCDARWLGDNNNHNATCNFWRGIENLSARDYVTWAVSQATFMRRVHLEKTIYLHDANGWSSGGFLSNSKVELAVNSGSQQQWLSRNCDWGAWLGENWNMVFAGIQEGKTPEGTWPEHAYTDVPVVEEIREKPYLTYDAERGFGVYVPDLRREAVGVDWTPGEFLPIEDFYIARPFEDTAETINAALESGKHLFLTPGIYQLTEPIRVERDGTIVLGTGLATLRSMEGNACMETAGDARITLAGILFDAGPGETEYLLKVGSESEKDRETQAAPEEGADQNESAAEGTGESEPATLLADLFFRVGGAKGYNTDVKCCVNIYQDHVIGDNFWVWRADHGSGVGWEKNRAANGIRVAGDDVTIYALMVEHFQEYQTIWEGENGKIIFYQCEIPYDVPDQESWKSHEGAVNGFASIKLTDTAKNHESWGLGIYLYNRDAQVELHSAMEAPEDADVRVHHICTVMITGNPGMSHIINAEGDGVMTGGARAVILEWGGQ